MIKHYHLEVLSQGMNLFRNIDRKIGPKFGKKIHKIFKNEFKPRMYENQI